MKLTEEQKTRFSNLARVCMNHFPNVPLTIKEGWVWIGRKKYENAESFLSKTSIQIQEKVRQESVNQARPLI